MRQINSARQCFLSQPPFFFHPKVLLVCLAAVAAAAPRPQDGPPVAILRDDRHDDGNGNFNYAFESEDGTSVSAAGAPGAAGQSNIQGSFRWVEPLGVHIYEA